MRKLLTTLFLIAFLCPLAVFAANTGNLKGKVFLDNKEPAMGATIKVKGSNQGTKARADGSFQIMGIPAGTHNITISFVSYADKNIQVAISADATEDIGSITLTTDMKQTKDIIIVAQRTINHKNTGGSQVNISGEAMQNQAKEGIAAMVGSTAGVNSSGDGWNIRGGRSNETAIRMDGVSISNPLNGGFGFGGTSLYPMPSSYAVAETQVKKGTFSAEYGGAMAGYVNSSLSSGKNDKYEGFLRWRTDVPALWGRQGEKLKVIEKDGILKAENGGEGYKLLGANQNSIDFGFGGPIPLTDQKATFYLSTVYKNEEFGGSSYDISDPLGNSLGQMDNSSNWVKNITARVKYDVTDKLSVTLGGSYGLTSSENNSWSWLYADDLGVASTESYTSSIANNWVGVKESIAKQNVNNIQIVNVLAKIRQIFETSILNFSIAYNVNNEYSGRRKNADDPDFFSGFELLYPQDNYEVVSDEVNGSRLVAGKDQVADYYKGFRKKKLTSDGFYEGSFLDVNPLTGFIEGDFYYNTDNAYGLNGGYFSTHNNSGFEFRNVYYWQVNADYELSIEQDLFKHAIKTGFEASFYELNRHMNPSPTIDAPAVDVYTDKWGGNIYSINEAIKANSGKAFKPTEFSFFLLDQIEYKAIVINPGLRLDYFNPNSRHRTNAMIGTDLTFASIEDLADNFKFTDTDAKIQISPRINISYPIDINSNIQIGYGVLLQRGSLEQMYDGFNSYDVRGGTLLGNPDMKPQRTNSYQIEYELEFADMFAFIASAYYRDIYNQVGVTFTKATPNNFYTYTTTEYGSTKGFEVTFLKKPLQDNIGFEVNYAYSNAIGTAPSATSNVGRSPIPNTDINTISMTEYIMGFDIPHKINANINLGWANDEGPTIGGIELLENANINFSTIWQSGSPYTPLRLSGEAISEANLARQPSYWRVDLRFQKGFQLRDFFGDAAGNTRIQFFIDIINLFDRTAPTAYYSRTNDPDDDGTSFYKKVSEFSPVTYYDKADFTKASSFNSNQYDEYGNRLYNEYSDLDKNGLVTREEQFKQFQKYLTDASSFRGNYQAPRTVYFGIKLDF